MCSSYLVISSVIFFSILFHFCRYNYSTVKVEKILNNFLIWVKRELSIINMANNVIKKTQRIWDGFESFTACAFIGRMTKRDYIFLKMNIITIIIKIN